MTGERYEIRFQAAARRAIAERLPESVAAAVLEFCEASLALSPRRVGKPLFGPLAGCHGARRGTYRIVYRIDEQARTVEVLDIDHRGDIYRRSLHHHEAATLDRPAPAALTRKKGWPQMRTQRKLPMAVGVALALAAALPAMGAARAGTTGPGDRQAARPAATAGLTAQQLAGQRVIYSYLGQTPPATLIWLIQHGQAAGVIFFKDNIGSKTQIAGVIKTLEQADASSFNPVRAPLLLMTDQEGGEVRRLPGAPVLSEKQIGATTPLSAAERLATQAGQGAAANLRSVGMNVNLAPVLDVYRTPGDFDDQFQRSYSSNQSVVSVLGANMIKAQQAGGVAATAKHFPGLGAATANQDTDVQPVTLNLSLATIRSKDEVPFQAAISAGVKLVMVSWAVYSKVSRLPAGLSPTIVQGELRTRLKFKGVTITDALEAGALAPYGGTANRALLAAKAGMDLILAAAQNVPQGQQVKRELAAVYGKTLPQAAFLASVNRIIALRESLK